MRVIFRRDKLNEIQEYLGQPFLSNILKTASFDVDVVYKSAELKLSSEKAWSANMSDANIVYKLLQRWKYLTMLKYIKELLEEKDQLSLEERIQRYIEFFNILDVYKEVS